MIYLKRTATPNFWRDFCGRNPRINYDDLQNSNEGRSVRQQLRQYNIDQQHGLCAYCCRKIDDEHSLNEHIKPKGVSRYSKLSMEYSNIVASCCTEGQDATCSAHKGNSYDENLFISPLDANCEKFFEYHPNGQVVSDLPEGEYTIDLLNLNSYKLQKARAAQIRVCMEYNNPELVKQTFLEPDADNKLQPFADIVNYFYENCML